MTFVGSRAGLVALCLYLAIGGMVCRAQDWPTFGHDERRGAASAVGLRFPLARAWVHQAEHAPSPAWPPPARADYYHYKKDLNPRVTFDHAYQVAAVGERIYYGSSTDDSIVCLDAGDGMVRWTFHTEGPVRLAPTVAEGRLYVGSDDGHVYCLSGASGELIWERRIGPDKSRCIGNGRVISRWPVRSGVLVHDGVAYCAAGLFPGSEGVFLAGLDEETGATTMRRKLEQSVQGYMALTPHQLILPSGRTSPFMYRLEDGSPIGEISSEGGTYAVIGDDVLAAGPGDTGGQLSLARPDTAEHLMSVPGLHLISHEKYMFINDRSRLAALDRGRFIPLARRRAVLKQQQENARKLDGAEAKAEVTRLEKELEAVSERMESCWLWKTPCDHLESLILAGDKLYAGGNQLAGPLHVLRVSVQVARPINDRPINDRPLNLVYPVAPAPATFVPLCRGNHGMPFSSAELMFRKPRVLV